MNIVKPWSAPREPRKPWLGPGWGDNLMWTFLILIFVGVSAFVAAHNTLLAQGSDADRIIMFVLSMGSLAAVTLIPGLTLGKRLLWATLPAVVVWLCCVSYNGIMTLRYFDRHFSDASASDRRGTDVFTEVRDELQRLRERRAQILTARPVETIAAEIARPETTRAQKKALEAEKAEADARDKLEAEIRGAAVNLANADAKGARSSEDTLAPLLTLVNTQTGLRVTSVDGLLSLAAVLICELGSILLPVAKALASGAGARASPHPHPTTRALPASLSPVAAAPPPLSQHTFVAHISATDVRGVIEWLNARTEKAAPDIGEWVADMHADYETWAKSRGRLSLKKCRFGSILTHQCSLKKRQTGGRSAIKYFGVALKLFEVAAPPPTKRSRVLQLVVGGAQ